MHPVTGRNTRCCHYKCVWLSVAGTYFIFEGRQAVQSVHNPADLDVAEAARVRLAFDELLFMQLTLLVRRALSRCGRRTVSTPDSCGTAHPLTGCCPVAHKPAPPRCHFERVPGRNR